ncbi:macro domain-containing protein, partial [Salmonella enterica]
ATDYAAREKLGTFSLAYALKGSACFNLYTQYEPGPNLDYGALVNAFQRLDKFLSGSLFKVEVYIPRIGAG